MDAMSTLICITYEDEYRASEIFPVLLRLWDGNLIDIDDAVTVTRDWSSELHLHHLTHLTGDMSAHTFWQALLHALLIAPLTNRHEGGAGTEAPMLLATFGIATDFAANLRERLQPGNSAMLIFIRRSVPAWGVPEVSRFGGAIAMTPVRVTQADVTRPEMPG
jgi:uncharacterized membrane protein